MTLVQDMARHNELDPLGAGAFLVSVVLLFIGAGALVGLVAGNLGIGIAIGAVVGIPASVGAVIVRYRNRV